jgi:hypothetical protein
MLFILSTRVLIRHLWQSKTAVFQYRCLMRAVLFVLQLVLYQGAYGSKKIPYVHLAKVPIVSALGYPY